MIPYSGSKGSWGAAKGTPLSRRNGAAQDAGSNPAFAISGAGSYLVRKAGPATGTANLF